jgi:CheY-like chemotaxis protein
VPVARPSAPVGRLAPGQPAWRVLAVDDLPDARRLLVRLLQPIGFEVREAADGQQAVQAWREWRPHLVWMDLRMPVMGGAEAARRIKAEPGGAATVVVALSASSHDEERAALLADGFDDVLSKPFAEDAMFELLQRHLGARFERLEADAAPAGAAGAGLPNEVRAELLGALEQLDVARIRRALEAARGLDPALADAVGAAVRDFDFGAAAQRLAGWAEAPPGPT